MHLLTELKRSICKLIEFTGLPGYDNYGVLYSPGSLQELISIVIKPGRKISKS